MALFDTDDNADYIQYCSFSKSFDTFIVCPHCTYIYNNHNYPSPGLRNCFAGIQLTSGIGHLPARMQVDSGRANNGIEKLIAYTLHIMVQYSIGSMHQPTCIRATNIHRHRQSCYTHVHPYARTHAHTHITDIQTM